MRCLTFLIVLLPVCFSTDDCDSDKCYQNINNAHQQLRKLLNKGIGIVNNTIFPRYGNVFDGILKQLENNEEHFGYNYEIIEENLETLQGSFKDSSNYNKWLIQIKENLQESPDDENLKKILATIQQRLEYFENLLSINQNVTKICNKTNVKYNEFEKIMKNLTDNYEEIEMESNKISNRISELNKNIEDTAKETVKNYENFQKIQIPFDIEVDFIDGVEKKINKSLKNLQTDHQHLQRLLKEFYSNRSEIIQTELRDVGDTLNELQTVSDIIWQILNEYSSNIPKFQDINLLITDELIKLIDNADNLTVILENKLMKLEQDLDTTMQKFQQDKDKLNSVINSIILKIKENQQLLNDYDKFLTVLLNVANNREQIQFEIDKVEKSIDLINEKEEIELELNNIRKIYEELVKYGTDGICTVDVRFEE